MAEERQILLDIQVDKQGAQQALESTATQLELNKQELKELNQQYKEGQLTVQEYSKKKLQLSTANKELRGEQRDLIKSLDAEDNSLNALRANLSKLTKERNNLNTSTKEGQARFEELQGKILSTTDAIKEQEEAGGDFRRSVGNYGKALQDNIPLLNGYVAQLQSFKAGLIATQQGLGLTTKGLTGSAKALKIFKIALASTGIGAIVVALGSLITFLTTTQRGIDAVTKVTRPLQQIFQRLIGVVQDLGGDAFDALGKAIENPIETLKELGRIIVENVINRFQSLQIFGQAIAALFSGDFSEAAKLAGDAAIQFSTGIEDGVNKLQQAGTAIKDFTVAAVDAGLTIDELTKSIELQEIALIKLAGTNERIFEQQKEIAENSEEDIRNRIAAAREALRVQTELETARIQQLDRRIQLKKLENEANDTSREDLKELAELEAERDRAAAEAAGKRTSVNNLLNSLLKQQKTELQEILELEKAREELETFKLDAERLRTAQRIELKSEENKEIEKLTFDSVKAQEMAQQTITDSLEKQSQIRKQIQEIENEFILNATGGLLGSLSGLFDQSTAAYKVTASLEAAIATYGAINKTLNDPTIPSTVARLIAATSIGIQGFSNVAKINGLGKGGGGGATGGGASGAVSTPRIDSRTTLSGAFDRNQLTNGANQQQAQTDQITNTFRNLPQPVVKVTDINKTQKRTSQVKVNSGL